MISSKHLPGLEPADRWRERALCGIRNLPDGVSPELWFADLYSTADVDRAKAICALCPVRTPCREEALELEGAASGDARGRIRRVMTGEERYALYRHRRGKARPR